MVMLLAVVGRPASVARLAVEALRASGGWESMTKLPGMAAEVPGPASAVDSRAVVDLLVALRVGPAPAAGLPGRVFLPLM